MTAYGVIPTPADRIVTERQLHKAIMGMAEEMGLLVYDNPDPMRSPAGFPDMVIAGHRGVIFAELKSEYGELRPRQRLWAEFLIKGRATWWLWRPSTYRSGEIKRQLEAIK